MNHDKSSFIRMTAAAVVILVLILLLHAFHPIPVLSLAALGTTFAQTVFRSAAAAMA